MTDSRASRTKSRPAILRSVPSWIVLATLLGVIFSRAKEARAQDAPTPSPSAQSSQEPTPASESTPTRASGESREGSKVGAGFKISSLGFGFELARQVTERSNVRGGFNAFSFSRGYDNNGIHYAGDLKWISAQAHYDFFPFRGAFHLSPGLMAYNDNHVTATASVPGGRTFTLNSVGYLSDPSNPLSGSAKVDFRKVAPTLMLGFGNLVPRSSRHISVNIEAGVAFQGSPRVALALAGSACDPNGLNCRNVGTDPTIQSNIQGQQTKISNDLSPFKFYPLVSLTFGYHF